MNKIVVITGGNSGIGKSTADMFRAKGDIALSLSLGIDEEYKDYSYICDISNEEQIVSTMSAIKEKYGCIDILINNAGFGVNGAMELIDTATFKKISDINVFGAYCVTKYALPLMSKGSKIVNISSVSGLFPAPFRGLYCYSKSALNMYSLCQRMELKQAGLDVCIVCPGEVKTGFMKNRVRCDQTNERYGKQVERAFAFLDKHDDGKRMSPNQVAKVIVKQATRKRTKAIKIVGFPFKLMYFAYKFTPKCVSLWVINKFMGGGTIE